MSSMTKSTGMPKPVTVALSETDKVKRGSSSIPTLTSKVIKKLLLQLYSLR